MVFGGKYLIAGAGGEASLEAGEGGRGGGGAAYRKKDICNYKSGRLARVGRREEMGFWAVDWVHPSCPGCLSA